MYTAVFGYSQKLTKDQELIRSCVDMDIMLEMHSKMDVRKIVSLL